MVPASFKFYDARKNTYFVATPDEIREVVPLPDSAAEAAATHMEWTPQVVPDVRADSRKANGLLVGPFPADDGFGLLIVNTDGSLAEFSGNGLTIFSQFLVDYGPNDRSHTSSVEVHHHRSPPLRVQIDPEGKAGFRIYMTPTYGARAVEALDGCYAMSDVEGRDRFRVEALANINAAWTCSQFVRVGNPHCVTFLDLADWLAFMDRPQGELNRDLTAIAFSSEDGECLGERLLCSNGINLQWAFVAPNEARSIGDSAHIVARVFERGERWTPSSGSSATAIACAARRLGLVTESVIRVATPGGVAPVHFDEASGRVMLFGEAQEVKP